MNMSPGKAAYEARRAHERAMKEKAMNEAEYRQQEDALSREVVFKFLSFASKLLSGRAHIQVQIGQLPVQVRLVSDEEPGATG